MDIFFGFNNVVNLSNQNDHIAPNLVFVLLYEH